MSITEFNKYFEPDLTMSLIFSTYYVGVLMSDMGSTPTVAHNKLVLHDTVRLAHSTDPTSLKELPASAGPYTRRTSVGK